jgi:acyl carrier protein
LIDLGVDSLVGVELRTWLLKELSVDMPVLKILGGASASDLVDIIIEKLPQGMSKIGETTSSDSDSGPTTSSSQELGSATSESTSIHEVEGLESKTEMSS